MSENLIALQNKFLGRGTTVYDKLSVIHDAKGCIEDSDIAALAKQYNLPPAHIRSTAKFYEELGQKRPADHTVKVCIGEACRAAPGGGCDALEGRLSDALGTGVDQVSEHGVRLEHVACLGYCGLGPNAMVDDLPVSLAGGDAVDRVAAHLHDGAPLGLEEPTNPVYLPDEGEPRILLRHFDPDEPQAVVPLEAARRAGVYESLRKALHEMTPDEVIAQVEASRLRGRGGAGFPTGLKLRTVANAEVHDGSGQRYVVDNCDEGDAGSYIDKELLERDPHTQLEGLLIAAYACGARDAYIYLRYEYPRAMEIMRRAIDEARGAGLIGEGILGSDFDCEVHLVKGQGAYICGEETSLLRSLEGVPGLVSFKPPYPAEKGLNGYPTAVNNTETLHNLPWVIEHGGEAYARFGHEKSRGTKLVSLNTAVKRPGLYEVELGITLRELIDGLAGGMANDKAFKAIQIGGPLGGILAEEHLDTPLAFEELAAVGGILGHAGIVVYDEDQDLMEICRGLMHFCAVESCGKCFPCRIGSVRGTELFDQMLDPAKGGVTDERLDLLTDLCEAMELGSLCALGTMAPLPIQTMRRYFPDEVDRHRVAGGNGSTPEVRS
ncbi:MAG: NADH-quinone oxidoreductase subunit F [Gemmatimonadales bacterium]|nr:MAG: NADH-quinone oxidoreductase subunit F [Gemmatimonadales bacterium]